MDAPESAGELWRTLQADAGLEVRRRGGTPGRDADVEAALKEALGFLEVGTTLDHCLDEDGRSPSPRVTVELFLVALLKSQEGYAAMMLDLLDLLVSANAARDDQELEIEFRFDEVDDPIRVTLEAFRKTVERLERMLVSRYALPPVDVLWNLQGELRKGLGFDHGNWPSDFPSVPSPPPTGNVRLDAAFAILTELVAKFRALCRTYGATRDEASEAVYAGYPDWSNATHSAARGYIGMAKDYWDASTLQAMDQIVTGGANQAVDPADVAERVQPLLASLERRDEWVDRTYTELLDVLALPTWRKRHELYSVWVGGVLLSAARDEADTFTFHVADRVLSFAFSGNRLATYERDGEISEIWAELRSPLVGRSVKRSKGIQPDFRVLRLPPSASPNDATSLVLECKHYLAPSVSNFSQAAADYARSCSHATVLVVNHGPLDEARLAASVDPALQDRIRFIGHATALEERSSSKVRNTVKDILFPPRPVVAAPAAAGILAAQPGLATIRLCWDATLQDVDLSLELHVAGCRVDAVNFVKRGDLADAPFALLHADVRTGPGEERIDISAWCAHRYVIIATNYSGIGVFAPGSLHCLVTLPDGSTRLDPSGLEAVRQWRIAAIDIAGGVAKLIDAPAT